MMEYLMKLEMKKYKIKSYVLYSICAMIFCLLFLSMSLVDSATDPTQQKDTYETLFLMIELLLSFIYIMFYSVLIAGLILKEYQSRTILILFTYPIERKKLIGAKVLLISIFITISMLVGYLMCCGYVLLLDQLFDLVGGSFQWPMLGTWLMQMMFTIVVCIGIGWLLLAISMWKQSVSFTIVSALVLIFLRQLILSADLGFWATLLQVVVFLCTGILALRYALNHLIHSIK